MYQIASFGSIPALVVIFITWDAPVWRKAAFIGGSFAVGFAGLYDGEAIFVANVLNGFLPYLREPNLTSNFC